jgi:small subunit ribosomal protein S6
LAGPRAKLAREIPRKGGYCNVREYEVTVIIQPQLEDDDRDKLIERITDMLVPEATEEEKPAVDIWGKRRLAYPIQKNTEGFYVLYEAALDPTRIGEIERNLHFMEDILRYLVVRKEV